MGQTREQRVIKQVLGSKPTTQTFTPIATDMFLPNHSGMKSHPEFVQTFKGIIVMWSGAVVDIPTGWALCNGANGTPDLRNRFVVGAGDTYAVGATGGSNTHTLTAAEIPKHSHRYNQNTYSAITAQIVIGAPNAQGLVSGVTTSDTTDTGSGSAHENRPPYYALCFIMKL